MTVWKVAKELTKAWALGVAITLMVILPIVLGGVIGFFMDRWLHTMPIFFIVFLSFGVVASARSALKFKL